MYFKVSGLVLSLVLILGGCTTTALKETDEETVSRRATERYDFLIDNNYEAAYEYLSPGYRLAQSYQQYLGSMGSAVKRVDAEVVNVRCEEENVCTVDLAVYYFYTPLGWQQREGVNPTKRISEEKWIKVDGQWWISKKTKE